MLTLPTKKKWFDMMLSRIKTEEYREIKPYYTTRFDNEIHCNGLFTGSCFHGEAFIEHYRTGVSTPFTVKFVNGYGNDKPYFIAEVTLTVDTGYEDWGAEPNKEYYVLFINKIVDARVPLNATTPYSELATQNGIKVQGNTMLINKQRRQNK